MEDRWSRRALLSTIGAIAVAGCMGDGQTTETDSTPPGPTPTRTPTATETATTAEPTPEPPASIDTAWPVPGGDPGRSNGVVDAEGPVDPVNELWENQVDTDLSAPVVANETVFVSGADGTVLALDARTGDRRWETSVGAAAGTPYVREKTVYVPREEWIVALDIGDWTEHWRIETGPRAQMLVAPHGLYAIGDRDSTAVTRYSLEDGSERWRTVIDRCGVWPGYAIAGSDEIYVSTGHTRRFPWVLSAGTGTLETNPEGCATDSDEIRFYREGTVVSVNPMGSNIVALVDAGAEVEWNQNVSLALNGICGDSQRVFVVTSLSEDAGITGLSLEDGSPSWSIERRWRPQSRPVVTKRALLCKSDAGLHCFDPADGTERWSRTAGDVGDEFVVADDVIYTTQGRTVRALR